MGFAWAFLFDFPPTCSDLTLKRTESKAPPLQPPLLSTLPMAAATPTPTKPAAVATPTKPVRLRPRRRCRRHRWRCRCLRRRLRWRCRIWRRRRSSFGGGSFPHTNARLRNPFSNADYLSLLSIPGPVVHVFLGEQNPFIFGFECVCPIRKTRASRIFYLRGIRYIHSIDTYT